LWNPIAVHIVQLVESGNPQMFGGVISSCLTRAKFLMENGHKVSLVCRGYPGWETPFEHQGVTVYPVRPKDYKLGKLWEKQYLHPLMPHFMAKAVDRIATEQGIDLLEINDSFPAQRMERIVAKHDFWVAHSIQGTAFLHPGLPPKVKQASMKWEEKVARMCDMSFPLSNYLASAFEPFVDQSRVRVVYNPIPLAFRDYRRQPIRLDASQPLQLLFMARMDSGKRILKLIEAIGKLPDPSRVRLKAVGQGDELAPARRLVGELNLRGSVEFTGEYVFGPEAVLAEYDQTDLVVNPTAMEGFSLAILECMGTRTPLLVTDLPPNVEALGQDYPLLFGVDNVQQLANQLWNVVENRSLLTAAADAMARRAPLFTPEACFTPMADALFELENGRVERRLRVAA
jgi:glycosyltransferase involved in cell wall biosynthesis